MPMTIVLPKTFAAFALIALTIFCPSAVQAQNTKLTPHQQTLYDLYKEIVEINSAVPHGTRAIVEKLTARLKAAGLTDREMEIVAPVSSKANLVVRYKGSGAKKPVLLLAHIDVVDARKEDWSDNLDPFKLTERDGYYYGRGTLDDKAMAAIFVANLIRLKQEGFKPARDIIVALTADEETGEHNGVAHLLKNRRELIDAEFALNEGGGGIAREGKPFAQGVQIGEKMYLSFDFEVTHAGGHSSVPGRENAIYDLSAALDRLGKFDFPARLGYATRVYFAKLGSMETGPLGQDIAALANDQADEAALSRISAVPRYNAQLRTTCVATKLEAGHAENALPQRAKAVVNCRLLPGEEPEFVRAELQKLAGNKVAVRPHGQVRVSPLTDAQSPVVTTIARISESMWPGVPVLPIMSAGATDGSRLRNEGIPTYGVSGIFVEYGEVRIHGRDERVGVKAFYDGQEFLYRLTKALSQ